MRIPTWAAVSFLLLMQSIAAVAVVPDTALGPADGIQIPDMDDPLQHEALQATLRQAEFYQGWIDTLAGPPRSASLDEAIQPILLAMAAGIEGEELAAIVVEQVPLLKGMAQGPNADPGIPSGTDYNCWTDYVDVPIVLNHPSGGGRKNYVLANHVLPGRFGTTGQFCLSGDGDGIYSDPGASNFGFVGGIWIDLGGDDQYISDRYSFGFMGLFVDLEGDDHYQVVNHGSSCAYLGGVFLDVAGDDEYDGCSGGGSLGGVFIDGAGEDQYQNNVAFGGYRQSLMIEGSGNDTYVVGSTSFGAGSDTYGGHFYDLSGNDRYESRGLSGTIGGTGSFGAGVSTFYDGGGHDTYYCEWGRCFAAHDDDATGIFVDVNGNDDYQGGDESFGFKWASFYDLGGHDRYRGGDRSFGAVPTDTTLDEALGPAGGFYDLWGDDSYEAGDGSFGVGSNFYDLGGDDTYKAGAGSFGSTFEGTFVDAGGNDVYPYVPVLAGNGLFWDSEDPADAGLPNGILMHGADNYPVEGMPGPVSTSVDAAAHVQWTTPVRYVKGGAITPLDFSLSNLAPVQVAGWARQGEIEVAVPGSVAGWVPPGDHGGEAAFMAPSITTTTALHLDASGGGGWIPGPPIWEMNVDADAPQLTRTFDSATLGGLLTWHSEITNNTGLKVHAFDDSSGVHEIRYAVDVAAGPTSTLLDAHAKTPQGNTGKSAANTVLDMGSMIEGAHTYHFWVRDAVGNTASIAQAINVDRTPPDAQLLLNGTFGADGWLVTMPSIEGDASDTLSGLGSATLEVIGPQSSVASLGAPPWNQALSVADGSYQVRLIVDDQAGPVNTAIEALQFKLDTVPPTTTIDPGISTYAPMAVPVTAQDRTSGIKSVHARSYIAGTPPTAFAEMDNVNLDGPGTWQIDAYAVDKAGNEGPLVTAIVQVDNRAPVASFDVVPGSQQTFQDIAFVDTSTDLDGTIVSRMWDFGDGNTSTDPTALHAYEDDGDYFVTLTVQDDLGKTNATTSSVTVQNRAPTLTINRAVAQATRLDTLTFLATASDLDGTAVVQWHMDGQTYNGGSVDHVFSTLGTHDVIVTATDDDGGNVQETLQVDIVNIAPTVAISAPTKVRLGDELIVSIDAHDPDGSIQAVDIDLGDGHVQSGNSAMHTYGAVGFYTVEATATDNDATRARAVHVVEVTDVLAPTATFQVPNPIQVGIPVTFEDRSTPGDANLATWLWTVAGETSASPDLDHTFQVRGDHDVTLRVTDVAGASDEVTETVHVLGLPPVASIEVPDLASATDLEFTSTSIDPDGAALQHEWALSDRNQEPAYMLGGPTYPVNLLPGQYDLALRVTDDEGMADEVVVPVDIANRAPVADFTLASTEHGTVELASTSSDPDGTIVQSEWTLGDTTVLGPTALHTFGQPGDHEITLRVEDDYGAITEMTQVFQVPSRPPSISIEMDQSTALTGESVRFTAIVEAPDGGPSVTWQTDDGVSQQGFTLEHAFADDGLHSVQASVTDAFGATTQHVVQVTIQNRPPTITIEGEDSIAGSIAFAATATDLDGTITSIEWSNGQVGPTARYDSEAGTLTVTATATDDDGTSTTASRTITVLPAPVDDGQDGSDEHGDANDEDSGGDDGAADENAEPGDDGSGNETGKEPVSGASGDKQSPAIQILPLLVALLVGSIRGTRKP